MSYPIPGGPAAEAGHAEPRKLRVALVGALVVAATFSVVTFWIMWADGSMRQQGDMTGITRPLDGPQPGGEPPVQVPAQKGATP